MLISPFDYLLFRVQLDNHLLLDILRNVSTLWHVEEFSTLCVIVPLNPWVLAVVEACKSSIDYLKALRLLAHCHYHAWLYRELWDVDNLAVNSDVLVANKLTCCSASRSDTKTVYNIVKAALKELEKNFTCYA